MKLRSFLSVFPQSQEIEIYQMADSLQTLYRGECICPRSIEERYVVKAYFTDKLVIEIADIMEELGK